MLSEYKTRSLRLSVGQRIVVRPEGFEGLAATVRWVSKHQVGVEFERPLYGPVVEHIQQKQKAQGMYESMGQDQLKLSRR